MVTRKQFIRSAAAIVGAPQILDACSLETSDESYELPCAGRGAIPKT